jgi:hypothetical protein
MEKALSVAEQARRSRTWRTVFVLSVLFTVGPAVFTYGGKIGPLAFCLFATLAVPFLAIARSSNCPRCGWNLFIKKNAISNTWTSPSIPDRCPNCDLDLNQPYEKAPI